MVEHSNTVHVCQRLFNRRKMKMCQQIQGVAVQRQVNKLCYHSLNTLLYATIYNALCSYPLVKMEIRDLIQILTTAPNYFRQKYLEIAS